MERRLVRMKETIASIVAEPEFFAAAEAEIASRRQEIEEYIARDPRFLTTLEPYEVAADAPVVVRQMADAAARVGVGPMAAVAGAIAECAVRAMVAAGAGHAIVDNGGDIAMRIARPVTVGIFAGPSPIRDLALRFKAEDGIVSVCTSSGTVGHSLSFGRADAAVAIAKDAAVADAAATALGNGVKSKDAAAIEGAMAPLHAAGVRGMLVIIGDLLVASGELPEIVRARVDHELIAKG
jgi:ApbE superfamily uncharacterized protein (UPF0280 family)